MPRVVLYILEQRLLQSRPFTYWNDSCVRRANSGLRFSSGPIREPLSETCLRLYLGDREWGTLCLDPIPSSAKEQEARRCLENAASDIQDWLNHSGNLRGEIVPGAVRKTAVYLRTRYRSKIYLADAAKEAGLSRERLSRLFHQSLGVTFSDYLRAVRCREARRVLKKTPDHIKDIGLHCGFGSISQFNRSFRAFYGCSPREFRSGAED